MHFIVDETPQNAGRNVLKNKEMNKCSKNYLRKVENIMVSIIIPTYNRKDTVLQSIRSVLEQTYSDIEAIVVDDCSTDGTEDVIKSIKSSKLKYIKCSQNRGVAASRNIGLEIAQGEYIAFNDSDDIWKKNKLELQMRELKRDTDCGMVYCAFSRKKGDKLLYIIPSAREDRNELSGKIFDFLLEENVIGTPTMLLKREVFDAIGNFKTDLRLLDDYEFVLRVANKFSIGYVDEVLVDTYEMKDTINAITADNLEEFMRVYLDLYGYWIKKGISKEKLKFLSKYVINNLKNFEEKTLRRYSRELVPKCFSSEKEMIKKYWKEKCFYRNCFKDDMMRNIFSEKIQDVIKYIGNRKTAIYGNGYVGKCLYYILKKNGTCIECIIDQNIKEEEYLVVNLEDPLKKVEFIILTVYDPIKKIQMEIKRHHPDKEVAPISEIFTPVE